MMRCELSVGEPGLVTLLGILLCAPAAVGLAQASAGEPAYIAGVVFLGSGCAEGDGTVAQLMDLDGNGLPEQFTVLFSKDYVATGGPSIGIAQHRRNCNFLVQAHLPAGYQVGVAGALQTGYASLPEGTGGTQRTDYVFTFYSDTASRETQLIGDFNSRYERTDDSGGVGLVWSPCGLDAPLTIRTEVYVQGDTDLPATMSMDYLAPTLIWRPCATAGTGRPAPTAP